MDIKDRAEIAENISYLIQEKDVPSLRNIILDTHPADLADIMRELGDKERDYLFSLIDSETASDVLLELDEVTREELIEEIATDRLSKIIDEMDSDDATDVVAELPDELAEKVLSIIDTKDRAEVEQLLEHDEETAGGIMQLEFVAVYEDQTVDDAIQVIRHKAQEVEPIHHVYAIDRAGKLRGVVPLKDLILAGEDKIIKDIMDEDVISVTVEKDQEHVARLARKYDLISVPVVDHEDRLVGRITFDDIVDVMHEEAAEDLHRMAGITDEEVLQENSTLRISRLRMPWLLVAFFGELVSAYILSRFQASLGQILAMAFFIPIIMAMGGNAGMQSSTIVVRSIAMAEGGATDLWSRVFRELRVALLNGFILALLIFAVVSLWLHQPSFGLVIGIAMLVVILNASVVGSLVPFVLNRMNYDPAIATGPFITTSNDVLGLFIYLTLGTVYLKYFS